VTPAERFRSGDGGARAPQFREPKKIDCGVFAKSITCTIDTNIQNFGTGGRWSCAYVDGQ
jgi:hypothetical protein